MTDTNVNPHPTLLDRFMNWLGMARVSAYRMWKWQNNEAIIVSTHSTRAWVCRVEQHPVCGTDDPPAERIVVIEIDRETGAPVKLPEPESYHWKSSFEETRERDRGFTMPEVDTLSELPGPKEYERSKPKPSIFDSHDEPILNPNYEQP